MVFRNTRIRTSRSGFYTMRYQESICNYTIIHSFICSIHRSVIFILSPNNLYSLANCHVQLYFSSRFQLADYHSTWDTYPTRPPIHQYRPRCCFSSRYSPPSLSLRPLAWSVSCAWSGQAAGRTSETSRPFRMFCTRAVTGYRTWMTRTVRENECTDWIKLLIVWLGF